MCHSTLDYWSDCSTLIPIFLEGINISCCPLRPLNCSPRQHRSTDPQILPHLAVVGNLNGPTRWRAPRTAWMASSQSGAAQQRTKTASIEHHHGWRPHRSACSPVVHCPGCMERRQVADGHRHGPARDVLLHATTFRYLRSSPNEHASKRWRRLDRGTVARVATAGS